MRKLIPVLSLCFFASACAHTVKFNVESQGAASIEVDGITLCDKTPCVVELRCKDPVLGGVGAWFVASPLERGGHLQRKFINPCEVDRSPAMIRFNMGLVPVTPVDQKEITIHQK